MTFYNTNHQTGEDLKKSTDDAKSQEKAVIELFDTSIVPLTASEVWLTLRKRNIIHPDTPITSIRRAISSLKKKCIVVRTFDMKTGIYNKSEHYYKKAA